VIDPGHICRDRTCKTFKIAIVLGPSQKGGKLRVCRWQASLDFRGGDGGYWSAPCALFEHQLEPFAPDFDLTSRRGLVVAAARRSVVNGLVRWNMGRPPVGQPQMVEVHHVGTVRP
jgi:hypothetical protein